MESTLGIQENFPLAPLTTLKVGGPARYFATARCEDDVREAIRFSTSRDLPLFILGGGSNLLVSDTGFNGLVLLNRIGGIVERNIQEDSAVTLDVGAGEDWDQFVANCVQKDLAGVECLSGIPGTVGATPIQNVGAYGQEVSETIVSVSCIERESGNEVEFTNEDCLFAYRSSVFNGEMSNKFIVTRVRFRLAKGGASKISYRDLQERFRGVTPTLSEVRSTVIQIRAAKSMVIDPEDQNSCSAGSFFKNPVVSADKLNDIRRIDERVPSFPSDGNFKVPAAWLIENSGVKKGMELGRAGISANHSLAIINRGGATAAEIIVLRDEVRQRVADRFGIFLDQEPILLGFD